MTIVYLHYTCIILFANKTLADTLVEIIFCKWSSSCKIYAARRPKSGAGRRLFNHSRLDHSIRSEKKGQNTHTFSFSVDRLYPIWTNFPLFCSPPLFLARKLRCSSTQALVLLKYIRLVPFRCITKLKVSPVTCYQIYLVHIGVFYTTPLELHHFITFSILNRHSRISDHRMLLNFTSQV